MVPIKDLRGPGFKNIYRLGPDGLLETYLEIFRNNEDLNIISITKFQNGKFLRFLFVWAGRTLWKALGSDGTWPEVDMKWWGQVEKIGTMQVSYVPIPIINFRFNKVV